jgi:hypothetical protein
MRPQGPIEILMMAARGEPPQKTAIEDLYFPEARMTFN